jgi:inhibitor of cysteine peptidase
MVQKEIRKKTKIYGAVAVLSAIVLVSMIYAFGSTSTILPSGQNPSGPGGTSTVGNLPNQILSGMKTFSSIDELRNYINNTSQQSYYFAGGPLDSQFFGSTTSISAPSYSLGVTQNLPSAAGTSSKAADSYSTTNVQVAGVDEPDTVKTDGQYIYTVSTSQNPGYYFGGYNLQTSNAIYIISANPQNPQIISKISLGNDTEPAGLFLSQDSSKLVVLASKYQVYAYANEPIPLYSTRLGVAMLGPYQSDVYTYINVYDISNKANPVLARNFTVTGSYFDSRMIDNYVYAVVSQPAIVYNNTVNLPAIYNGKNEYGLAPTSIYYTDMVQPSYYTFTSFFGMNILDNSQQPTNMTIMMGGASTMYVSTNNMYVTYPTWTSGGEYTSIYRVSINASQLTFEAQGNVTGYTINQYSMDEYNGYFRIATNFQNTTISKTFSSFQPKQMNNIYVLNSDLTTIGKLEGVAQNENLYAARFMGNRCFLVTFKQTDPFFVIDLINPVAPKVAGELKIPGYSSYLHPYDENHVIGLGSESQINSGWESTNVKLSLFDVTDINNPSEIANYMVQGNYTSSIALNDPKAFLFDLQKQLLVIPVSINNYYYYVNNSGSATSGSQTIQPPAPEVSPGAIISTTDSWQGAYVFNVNLNGGFTLKGTVTHLDPASLNSQGYLKDSSTYWNTQNNWITRSLYIGNTLYTMSNAQVKLNSLTDMTQIAQINLT